MRNLGLDIEEMQKLKSGQLSSLANLRLNISPEIFKNEKFLMSSVLTKAFILMLSKNNPLSFISGTPVDLGAKLRACNRKEFHHLMPRAFLRESEQTQYNESCLANFCFISRTDNRILGGGRPSVYRDKMAENVEQMISSHYCPNALFDDNYEQFINNRSELLYQAAKQLCALD